MFENLNKYKLHNSANPIFVVDSDVLIDICKMGPAKSVEERLLAQNAILIFPTVSAIEIGFGPYDQIEKDELGYFLEMRKNIFINKFDLFAQQFSIDIKKNGTQKYSGKWVNVSPDSNIWSAAKEGLLFYMRDTQALAKNARKLQMDFLIASIAWNTSAFVWSNNTKDHLLASLYRGKTICSRNDNDFSENRIRSISSFFRPIFNTDILTRYLNGEKIDFFSELKPFSSNREIEMVLDHLQINNYGR